MMQSYKIVKMEPSHYIDPILNPLNAELHACRVCFCSNKKLYYLHHFQLDSAKNTSESLAEVLSEIVGAPVSPLDGLPQHICNICIALFLRCAAFRARCRQSNALLNGLKRQVSELTTSYLQTLEYSFLDSLAISKTTTADNQIEIEPIINNDEINVIKSESIDNTELADYDHYNDIDDIPLQEILNNSVKDDSVKLEIEQEPCTIKKTPKKTKKKTKAKKEEKVEPKEQKKKRMYNRKDEEDFVEFSKHHSCDVIFLTREQQLQELENKKNSIEYTTARFQCEHCGKCFMKESAYTKHMACHDPSVGNHVCDVCHVRFPVRHKLMKHFRRHRMIFSCQLCGASSRDSTMAKMHFKWHQGFKFTCQHCGKTFNKQSSYMNHVREKHASLSCAICGTNVSGTRGMAQHQHLVHEGIVKCEVCAASFSSHAALDAHRAGAGAESAGNACAPHPCGVCGAALLTAAALREHLRTDHADMLHRCELCGATYSTDRHLGIHWTRAHRGHTRTGRLAGPKPRDGDYMCEVCAKSYPNETALRYHQRIHTGEKPYQCAMCPKSFRLKTNLQVHINTHTGERPFKCPLCPERFKSYSQRHKHGLLVHTKDRRHKCHMCEKTYVVSFDLKMHIRTVHMKIPLPPRNRRRKTRAETMTL